MNKLLDKQKGASSARNAGYPWLIYFGGSYAVSDYRAGAGNGLSVRCVAQHLRLFLFGFFLNIIMYGLRSMEGFGYYWSSSASTATYAWHLYFRGSGVYLGSGGRSIGFSVRCVAQNLRLISFCSFLSTPCKRYFMLPAMARIHLGTAGCVV